MEIFVEDFVSPIGPLRLRATDHGIIGIEFDANDHNPTTRREAHAHLRSMRSELEAYFRGELHSFATQLCPHGTPFQLAVWRQLLAIPYGETRSYSQVAESIGNPRAVRAVGTANGANRIAIVIPCHRVIASDGSLGGYGGGLDRKHALLHLEGGYDTSIGSSSRRARAFS